MPLAPAPAQCDACRFAPSPELVARGVNVDRVRARLREHGEIIVDAAPRIDATGGIAFEFLVDRATGTRR